MFAGGIAAAANFGSHFIFSRFFDYGPANFLAYVFGMLVAFLLMLGHVFDVKSKALMPQVLKFAGVNILVVVQTLIISIVLARWVLPFFRVVDHAEALAHLVGVLVPVVTSYFGHKLFTFR